MFNDFPIAANIQRIRLTKIFTRYLCACLWQRRKQPAAVGMGCHGPAAYDVILEKVEAENMGLTSGHLGCYQRWNAKKRNAFGGGSRIDYVNRFRPCV